MFNVPAPSFVMAPVLVTALLRFNTVEAPTVQMFKLPLPVESWPPVIPLFPAKAKIPPELLLPVPNVSEYESGTLPAMVIPPPALSVSVLIVAAALRYPPALEPSPTFAVVVAPTKEASSAAVNGRNPVPPVEEVPVVPMYVANANPLPVADVSARISGRTESVKEPLKPAPPTKAGAAV